MLLGKQVYSNPRKGSKNVSINIDLDERYSKALNFTGYAYVDCKFGFVKSLIAAGCYKVIVTNQDLIARLDYAQHLDKNMTVVFVFEGKSGRKTSVLDKLANVAFGPQGASKQRLKNAQARLNALGFKTKFFVSEKSCLNYLKKLEGAS